jgi:hypothetical protein
MKKHIMLVLCQLYWLAAPMAYATQVDSIYKTSIPVASQSTDDRVKVEPQALLQVLAKVSGNSHVFQNEDIKTSLSTADTLVDEFSYSSSPSTPATPYILSVNFDANSVNHLLRNTGIRVWGRNRPLLLAWIEYEEPKKPAVMIETDSPNVILGLIKQYADQRGLPVMLPTMDIKDLNQVSVNDIVTMNLPVLQQASSRYANEALLIARVLKLQDGYVIQSKMLIKRKEWNWNIPGKTLDDVVAILMDNITDAMAGRYSTASSNVSQLQVTLKVTGISEEGDLSGLTEYVNHLSTVSDVAPIRIESGEVLLKVSLRGTKEDFIQALSEGEKMLPAADTDENMLHYQWIH